MRGQALGAAAALAAVTVIYWGAAQSYFFNDDFHWLAQTQVFEPANLLRLERYDHFYRPIIELYFYAGLRLAGCEALPFHVASIAMHLACTLVLFLFARRLTGDATFAALSAGLFCVQPGYVEAVTWVGAITDLLPGLWYLLALWTHLLFIQKHSAAAYVATLAAFSACLLTHESSATLLPMMLALDMAVGRRGDLRARLDSIARDAARYAPFAVLLIGYLALAYVVNSRSYLVREGHYALGWHAIPNVFDYIVSLYVGKRQMSSYVLIAVALVGLLWRGSPLTRFFVIWIVVTLVPVSFFTWGTASRYLYVPAAGFAMLLAAMLLRLGALLAAWLTPRAASGIVLAVAAVLAVRFALFAKEGADSFRERTLPYERFVAAIRAAHARSPGANEVTVDAASAYGVPDLYRDPAAQVGLCRADVRVLVK